MNKANARFGVAALGIRVRQRVQGYASVLAGVLGHGSDEAMNEAEPNTTEFESYSKRRPAKDVKKPVLFPGKLRITGTSGMLAEIERLCPKEGTRRRESLLLEQVWREQFGGETVKKSELILAAAAALQNTDKAFGNQDRKNGDGLSRARCTCSKTCKWLLEIGLFVVVAAEPPVVNDDGGA